MNPRNPKSKSPKSKSPLSSSAEACLLSAEEAREELLHIRSLLDDLLLTKSDMHRIRIVSELKEKLILGFSTIDHLAVLSHIANRRKPRKT